MTRMAALSAGVGTSLRTGMARMDAVAGRSAIMALAAPAPSSATDRLKATIATPLINSP
jgi:hypothetical protein